MAPAGQEDAAGLAKLTVWAVAWRATGDTGAALVAPVV